MAASKLFLCNSPLFVQTSKLLQLPKLSPYNLIPSLQTPSPFHSSLTATRNTHTTAFTWDDISRISESPDDGGDDDDNDSSYLQPFFQRIKTCNRGSDKKSDFFPFIVEDQTVGYIHKEFSENLRKFKDVFVFGEDHGHTGGVYVTLHQSLESPEDRTEAVGYVIKSLGNLIPSIRNELYPVKPSYGMPICFSLERAAAPYFGIKAYGVHMNGYVEKDGHKYLWIAKRSKVKPTYPGMLDHLVAGGLPHDMACKENIIKECEEEAGIPSSISTDAVPVGAVSYMDIDGYCYKRDVLFCYDLKLADGFVPNNQDGEVESFKLTPLKHVGNIMRRTEFFKPNCTLVIIDFLFRHGFIRPEQHGYLQLLESLKSGDFS